MDKKRILAMPAPILLSWLNMKLRNEFSSLENLARFFELSAEDLTKKIEDFNVSYNKELNQFR